MDQHPWSKGRRALNKNSKSIGRRPGWKVTVGLLGAQSMDELFDVISMEVLYPGHTRTSNRTMTTKKNQKATLTCLCNLPGFRSLVFISQIDSDMMAILAFLHFFIPMVNYSNCKVRPAGNLLLYMAPLEPHNAIPCECFHQYLNKRFNTSERLMHNHMRSGLCTAYLPPTLGKGHR